MDKNFEDLQRLVYLVGRLQSTNSRTEKENILSEYINDYFVREVLSFLFDTMITTGLSSKKINKNVTVICDKDFTDTSLIEMLEYIKENNTGSDNIISNVQEYSRSVSRDNKALIDILEKIFTKDLKLGVSSTTLNKVFGEDFIKVHEVMLAQKYFDNPDKYLPEGTDFIITTKLDGVRAILINTDKGPKFLSRQGKEFYDLIELEEEAKLLPKGYILDGELLLNKSEMLSKDLYRETLKIVSSDKIKTNIIFNCFDMLTIEEFNSGASYITSDKRKEMVNIALKETKWFKPVSILYKGKDRSKIDYWLNKIVEEGGEGVMINLSNSPYECKRSTGLLKVKKFQNADIRIIGFEEGLGQNVGKLGAFKCEFIAPDGRLQTCDVGSGLSQEQRETFWNDRENMLNKIIQIKYFEISSNQQGNFSMRFPVFEFVREDKTEISMY